MRLNQAEHLGRIWYKQPPSLHQQRTLGPDSAAVERSDYLKRPVGQIGPIYVPRPKPLPAPTLLQQAPAAQLALDQPSQNTSAESDAVHGTSSANVRAVTGACKRRGQACWTWLSSFGSRPEAPKNDFAQQLAAVKQSLADVERTKQQLEAQYWQGAPEQNFNATHRQLEVLICRLHQLRESLSNLKYDFPTDTWATQGMCLAQEINAVRLACEATMEKGIEKEQALQEESMQILLDDWERQQTSDPSVAEACADQLDVLQDALDEAKYLGPQFRLLVQDWIVSRSAEQKVSY